MVITHSHYQQLFQQETKRLSDIDIEFSHYSEFSLNHIVYHPAFLSVMEEQVMNTLAKEQIRNFSKFAGAPDEDVIKWIQYMEAVFDRAQLQPSNKFIAIQSYLTDAAKNWFRYNKSSITDWFIFKAEIIKAYQPSLNQILLKMEK
ncbi:unnamed protein product [Rotaria sp. Silwood1]|nr:unnamed protein product [Rotaria sp. Silwood1]CAF1211885.1 unnamed protein product [Rotaria sp. Silwood1]CAF3507625.1 unnamed protein product [Rotaria sp. Silwood1]CAF5045799.1 unnamed protein product [Rotaria sp. Silwood1]